MHDTDRTSQFLEAGMGYESPFPAGQYESADAGELEAGFGAEFEGGYGGAFEAGMYGEAAYFGELIHPVTGEVNEEAELALAAELLSVSNEQELDQFLGKMFRKLGGAFRKFAGSGFGRFLGGALKRIGGAVLPKLGALIPGVGPAVAGIAGGILNREMALEFEGYSLEDREFELARRVVRLGIEGARALDSMPEGEMLNEENFLGALLPIAGKLLPGLASAATSVLPSLISGVSGALAGGAGGAGNLSGNINVRSPGGWQISAGGQGGGQFGAGASAGLNRPAPPVPFQNGRYGGVPAPAPRPWPRPGPGGGQMRCFRAGRWIRRGRNIIGINVF